MSREPWERAPWEGGYPEKPWGEDVLVSTYPENGPQSISVESLYQAFKERLIEEIAALSTDRENGNGA